MTRDASPTLLIARSQRLVVFVLVLALCTQAGCTNFNFNSWNTGLSDTTLQQKLESVFPVGSSRSEVTDELDRRSIRWAAFSEIHKGINTPVVQGVLDEPWWHIKAVPIVVHQVYLRFYFDGADRLTEREFVRGAGGL